MYVTPKHEISHKPQVLCRSLLSSIGPASALQAEYSAYAYSIQVTVPRQYFKNNPTKDEKSKAIQSLKFRDRTAQKTKNHVPEENNEIHQHIYYWGERHDMNFSLCFFIR